MKKAIFILLGVVLVFGGLFFAVDYKNKQAIGNSDNPYGKTKLDQETIKLLDDPLYQNQVTPNTLAEKLENKEDVTLYIYSPKCSYCVQTTPILVPLAEEMDVNLEKLNLLEFDTKKLRKEYSIEGTPTVIHFENGKEVDRIGGMPEEGIENAYRTFFEENVLQRN